MEELEPAAPAGWYPGPDGKQRYWDGHNWLQIPPPNALSAQPLPEARNNSLFKPSRRMWIVGVVAVLTLVGVGVVIQVAADGHDAKQAAIVAADGEKSREEQAARDKAKSDAAEAARIAKRAADAQEAREAKEAQAAVDRAERLARKESVSEIEKSIKKMARKHVREGIIDGPVIRVSCDPVAGGSVEDLSEKTTVFQCFMANKDNKDGTMSGHYYHATMNWGTGSYTYGFGES